MVSSIQGLAPITNPLNSVLIEKKLINVDQKFIQLVSLAEGLPRTEVIESGRNCLLYTSPSPRDKRQSRMPSSA